MMPYAGGFRRQRRQSGLDSAARSPKERLRNPAKVPGSPPDAFVTGASGRRREEFHAARSLGSARVKAILPYALDELDARGLLDYAARPQAEPSAPMAKTEFLVGAQSVRRCDDRRGALLGRHFGKEEDRLGSDAFLLRGLVDCRDHDRRELLHPEFEMLRVVGKDPANEADEHGALVLRLDRDDLADTDRREAAGHVVQREPARALVEDDPLACFCRRFALRDVGGRRVVRRLGAKEAPDV